MESARPITDLPEKVDPDLQAPSEEVSENTEINDSNRLKKSLHVAKRAVQSTVIALEILPTNEAIRFGSYAATLAATRDPVIGALVLGGSTLVVEGSAAAISADLVASKGSVKSFRRVNKKIDSILPEASKAKMSLTTQAALSYVGGSVVLMLARQREEPTLTVAESRKIGLKSAAALGGVFAVEGALVARGVGELDDWDKVAPAAVAVAGLLAAGRWAKKKTRGRSE